MISTGVGQGNSDRMADFLENLTDRLEDSVTSEPLTEAVVLNCGHSFNESTVRVLSKDPSKYLCPECRAPITDYKVSFALRRLAESVSSAPAPVVPQNDLSQLVEPVNEKEIKEAEAYYNRSRELFARGLQDESVSALFKALELNPNYEKALNYLDFITDPKNQRRSSLTASPVTPKPSAPPLDDEEKIQSPSSQSDPLQANSGCSLKGGPSAPPLEDEVKTQSLSPEDDALRATAGCFLEGYRLESRSRTEVVDAYLNLRRLLLTREVSSGKFSQDDLIRIFNNEIIIDFKLPLDSLCADYTNPQTGNREFIDVPEIADAAIKAALELVCEKSKVKEAQLKAGVSIIPNSKGNLLGSLPLDKKKDEALLKLPNNLEYAFQELLPQRLLELPSAAQRNALSRRLFFVKFFYSRICKKVETTLEQRKTALQTAGNDATISRLKIEIKRLGVLRVQLNNLDVYALYKALTAYPVGGPILSTYLDAVASSLQGQVEKEIQAIRSWWDNGKPLDPVHKEYAQDVAGMLYLDRGRYFQHCKGHNLKIKNEGIADIFLREAIKFATVEEYTADGFKKGTLLHNFEVELKKEMEKEFDALALLASSAIGHRQGSEYEIAEYPVNASPGDKKKIDQRRVEFLKGDIAAHRARVNQALAEEKISSL